MPARTRRIIENALREASDITKRDCIKIINNVINNSILENPSSKDDVHLFSKDTLREIIQSIKELEVQ